MNLVFHFTLVNLFAVCFGGIKGKNNAAQYGKYVQYVCMYVCMYSVVKINAAHLQQLRSVQPDIQM